MEEDSTDIKCEENKGHPEKNKKRQFKTPSQLQALEDFYNEHKYPTESMKAELAEKLGLTEKQISGWFCHRRLKDKRVINDESTAPGKQDLSSGVIQDRGSGLRQDSCSSNKQGDFRVADLREVESRRFCRSDIPAVEQNCEKRRIDDGTEMDDTSSESNSALQESFYPHNRSSLHVETTEYRAPNGLAAQSRRVGPSGYLKIKGQTENAAITAVKKQLGRQYQQDGPPLGIEFDPLPPGAFESPNNDMNTDAYGVPESFGSSSLDISGIHKRSGLSTMRNQNSYVEATDYRSLHKSDPDSLSYHQPKQKSPFSNNSRVFTAQKASFNYDSYPARETSDYDSNINHSILRKQDQPGVRSESYGVKMTSDSEEPWWPNYDNLNHKVRRKERLDSRGAALPVRLKDPINNDERVPPSRMGKDEGVYVERRPMSEHHDSIRLKMHRTNELRAGKREREEFLRDDYTIRTSQEAPQWSRPIKGSAEMPSSFSEDETAETSSSMD